MNHLFMLLFVCSSMIAGPLRIYAQEPSPPPQSGPKENEIETLRKRMEEQSIHIEQLQQALQQQSVLIEQQQQQLQSLQVKVENNALPSVSAVEAVYSPQSPGSAGSGNSAPAAKAEAAPKPAHNVETGYGKIKFNGLLQGWYAAGDGGFRDTFRLRRAELKFSGEITPQIKWTLVTDLAKGLALNNLSTTAAGQQVLNGTSVNQASRVLQDAFITFDHSKRLKVDVGQFKVPLSQEGLQSPGKLDTVERALFLSDRARGGAYGDVRDVGVMIRGPLTSYLDYQVGLFNGAGENQNDVDKNDQKALAGRLIVRMPWVRGLQFGGSGVWGDGARHDRPRADRLGTEVLFARGAFMFKSELMSGKDGALSRRGYYTHFGYKLTPKVDAIFRFDTWDPDTRRERNNLDVTERDYLAGFNYYLLENFAKLQFNYARKTFNHGLTPSRHLVLINFQTSW
ncbi:MAG TPA: porin [Blastocatellia bacterium]|nr:porin [Blastocatellia bacterium]